MTTRRVFYSSGWDRLEVWITPGAVGLAPAAEIVRIDAQVRHAEVHSHREVHHEVHHHAHQQGPHVTHPGGGAMGGGTIGGGGSSGGENTGGGLYGGGSY